MKNLFLIAAIASNTSGVSNSVGKYNQLDSSEDRWICQVNLRSIQ